ncbi:SDR family NAD(P)-dependent oxidoreductase [Nocardia seriolae]|uniref:Glucose 1-dehydrogenase n=1 Tax=Nocardia seriolae TaxID=37332 RepID=A0ABC8ANE8_9NOCA|nr:SDR family NAD(P)-dependent oxidoreductase [Nocardia seriolae]APA95695.1 Glucose 1-dehydrogenase [Nocardia seriolae]OJF82840.1 short-chain dehydrogenase [Nocardia seriolae]PSK29576.1 SDR family NAD(P)-dependent oxidoreductase [Nocardia seriolae]QOW33597.1 SDR family oxidoreductase [Nocardia seriolae]QUN20650.1 SDR family oxidoreductase [Nocardia seriolae]
MSRRYEGRRVLVTGAGSGIGQGVALRLLEEGARLVAADANAAGLAATVDAVPADQRERLRTLTLDISDPEAVRTATAAAHEFLGGLDVLVNAAGILRAAHTHEMPLESWNKVIAVNLTGTFLMIQANLPALIDSGHGVIVNFSSTAAFGSNPYMAAYSASKAGVNALTHSIALEYVKKGLRAVNIVPGGISTGITSGLELPADADWSLMARLPGWIEGGALGKPEDIAGVVAMAASDDGRYMTGTELRVDGGALM